MSERDLTAAESAEALSTTPATIRKMCAAGELPGAYRLREKRQSPWRIPVDAIEEHRRRRAGQYIPRSREWLAQALAS